MKSRDFVAVIAIALSGCASHMCVMVAEPHPIDVLNAGDAPYSQGRKIAGHFAIVFDDSIKKRANIERQFWFGSFTASDGEVARKVRERVGGGADSARDPWGRRNWAMKWSAEDAVVTSFRQLFRGLFERTTDYARVPSATIMQQQALRRAIVVELTQFDVTVRHGPYKMPLALWPHFEFDITGTTRASFRILVSGRQGAPMEIDASAVGTATDTATDWSFGVHQGCGAGTPEAVRITSRSIEDAIRQVLIQVSKQISESQTLQSTRAKQGGSPSLKHGFRLEDRSASSANAGIDLGVLGGAQKAPYS